MTARLAPLFFALLLTGCGNAPRPIATTAAQMDAAIANGRSANLHTGTPFSYWIWREDDGTWHLRTTAARQGHRFQGRVHASEPGAIQALAGVGLDARGKKKRAGGDFLKTENGDIVFDFVTKDNLDGFDFQLVGSSCVEFDLRIDGDGDPGKIHIGRNGTKPEKAHVVFCPK